MAVEVTRLLLGLMIAAFHRPIAEFFLERDRALVVLARQRGLTLPQLPSRGAAHALYFWLGIGVCLLEILRIWMLL